MKKLFTYGAASIFLLTAAPVAFAQNYNPNSGSDWNQGGFSGAGQGYNNQGSGWNQGGFSGGGQGYSNQGSGWNQGGLSGGGQGYSNQGSGWNQGGLSGNSQGYNSQGGNQGRFSGGQGWNQGGIQGQNWRRSDSTQGYGSSQQSGTQQSGMQGRDMNEPTAQDAWQELSKFGYRNIGGMERIEGWQARATKNGERVFVVIDDEGMVATYRGNGQ